MASYENTTIKKMTYNGQKVKKWYHDGVKVFSAGNVVTYYVDTDTIYTEEVDSEASCLSPTTFTPSKTGYTFVGWRNDTSASSDVLTTRIMGDEAISLYAVFKKLLTATFDGNSPTSGSVASISAAQYYNNGTTLDPTITLPENGFTKTNYTFTKWDLGTPGIAIVLTADITITAQWMASVYNYGYTGRVQSFTAPDAGTYKLEVWGAQGIAGYSSAETGSPGLGGYGAGEVELTKGQIIYICVGGRGVIGSGSGGYNGGGHGMNGGYVNACAGGGATHMAKANRGTLPSYANYKSELYLVAGGGGGAGIRWDSSDSGLGSGGSGGGSSGGAGTGHYGYSGTSYGAGNGGSQSGGGAAPNGDDAGRFGQGGQSASGRNNPGGGGGYYGGGAGNDYGDDSKGGGGGGSGYIGGVTKGTWSNGARSGDGYAKITLIALASAQNKTSFAFTGDVQEYTAPETGTYTLEVWGAQGGRSVDSYQDGGRGGYSYGNVTLTKGQVLYIYVGEKGSIDGSYTSSRYNGGGEGDYHGDGGGATHIATAKRGVLSNYASYKSEVLIVAGGGGGSSYHAAMGGYGGGSTGGDGTDGDGAQGRGQGGTQSGSPAYYWSNNAGFGQGGNGTLTTNYGYSGGGGGGWYGGTAGLDHEGGGGGSGYIGGVTDGVTMGDQRSGHGAANIYFLG